MNYYVIATPGFNRELKKLSKKQPSLKSDFAILVETLESKLDTGEPIGNDCYKIRMAIGSKGKVKSGGAIEISHLYFSGLTVFLLTIYNKGDQDDIPDNEVLKLLKNLQK